MASLEEIRARLGGYLDGLVSLDDFEDWFLSDTWNSHLHSDEETMRMVHRIEGNLLDFSAGAITESSLRKELALVARPSVRRHWEPVLCIVKSGNISMPQEISLRWGSSYEPHLVLSMSVSVPVPLELSCA